MTWGPVDDGDAAARAARWSQLHHGIDPAGVPVLSGWLRLMWGLARPLARAGVPPTALTATGVLLAGGALAAAGPRPALSAACVGLAAVCDGLDGAVAVVGGRATGYGRVADAVADRVCDVAFAGVLARLGAPPWSTGTAAGLALGVDTLRRVRRTPDRITVAERPTFTICAILAGLGTAAFGGRRPATAAAGVWITAGVIGVAQLLATPSPDGPSTAAPHGGAARSTGP